MVFEGFLEELDDVQFDRQPECIKNFQILKIPLIAIATIKHFQLNRTQKEQFCCQNSQTWFKTLRLEFF